jgi:hypothetical protein
MSELREFVSDLLERNGAVVESIDARELAVLSPPPVQKSLGLRELARLGFGAPGSGTERSHDTVPVGLEGDWMERFAALLHDKGRWSQRELPVAGERPTPGDPQRVLDRALDLPNAVCRFLGIAETHTRCLILTFRYTAISDEKREGLFWLGFNTGTGAVINDLLAQLRPLLAQMPGWGRPDEATVLAAGPGWSTATIESRVRPLIDRQVREEIEPFLRAMQRRLARDRDRVHAYHNGLHLASSRRLAALSHATSERAEADRRREAMRIEAIAREYRAKLDDLRRNYALRVAVEWVQALELYVPVQRFDVLIRRRKGERVIQLDWHPLLKAVEAPLCEAGHGRDRVRLVCDEKLHLTEPSGQAPCVACGKPFCRACFPAACPRCGSAVLACTAIENIEPRRVAS